MTSRQALEHIIFDAKMEKPIFSRYYQEFLKPIERDLEVLEIIKNKEVVVGLLKGILHSDLHTHTASYYNSHFVASYRHLTQEEFDLLKEWLNE